MKARWKVLNLTENQVFFSTYGSLPLCPYDSSDALISLILSNNS